MLVIDEDLGKSGASAAGRAGFQRLVTEVTLGHVGLVLGMEMSRLARSGATGTSCWSCARCPGRCSPTLDGVYDPVRLQRPAAAGPEGHDERGRAAPAQAADAGGKLAKARRGELAIALPIGYVRRPSGEVGAWTPTSRSSTVVRLVFAQVRGAGHRSHAVLRYLVDHGIELGCGAERAGQGRAGLAPAQPDDAAEHAHRPHLRRGLRLRPEAGRSPQEAPGQAHHRPRRARPRSDGTPSSKRASRPTSPWSNTSETSERLAANRARAEERGAVRHGPSLLQGLLICGKCGHRMQVRYGGPRKLHTYTCSRLATDYAEGYCHYLPGARVDEFVGGWVLKALEPAALELSLEASEYLEKEREELDGLWRKRLERASYEAERAGRHYRLIEPENRLVARQLAREWEEKLEAHRKLQEDYRRFVREQPRSLSALEREGIRSLAHDIPALWHSPSTTTAERKEIVRQVVERVVVENEGKSERLHVSIEWVGGSETKGVVIRPVSKMEYLSYYPRLCERVRELLAQELTIAQIAETLHREGYRPPKQAGRLGRQAITEVLQRLGLRPVRRRGPRDFGAGSPAEDEWWLADLASELRMPGGTLHGWIRRGWVEARKQESSGRWIVRADEQERQRLRRLRALPLGHNEHDRWLNSATQRMATQSSMRETT